MPQFYDTAARYAPGWARRMAPVLLALFALGGCRESPPHDPRAYAEALETVRRQEAVLAELERQVERHFGEFFLYRLEAQLQMGRIGLPQIGSTATDENPQLRQIRDLAAPFETGVSRLLRLLEVAATRLPWHDRSGGYLLERNAFDRYNREIRELQAKIAAQKATIREAKAYAELLAPPPAS